MICCVDGRLHSWKLIIAMLTIIVLLDNNPTLNIGILSVCRNILFNHPRTPGSHQASQPYLGRRVVAKGRGFPSIWKRTFEILAAPTGSPVVLIWMGLTWKDVKLSVLVLNSQLGQDVVLRFFRHLTPPGKGLVSKVGRKRIPLFWPQLLNGHICGPHILSDLSWTEKDWKLRKA